MKCEYCQNKLKQLNQLIVDLFGFVWENYKCYKCKAKFQVRPLK